MIRWASAVDNLTGDDLAGDVGAGDVGAGRCDEWALAWGIDPWSWYSAGMTFPAKLAPRWMPGLFPEKHE